LSELPPAINPTLAASLECVDGSSLIWVLRVFHHGDGPALLVVMKGEQAICSRHQLSYVVLFIALQLDPQPGREALQEQEHREEACLLVIWSQLYHLHQELGGTTAGQGTHGG
jgi:hypothetical protein